MSDPRIQYYKLDKNRGGNYARNFGARISRGELLMFLDSDDILHPNCIENRLKKMEEFPDKDFVVFAGIKVFNHIPEDTQILWNIFTEENDLDRFLRIDNPWHTTSPVWNKTSFLKLNGFREESIVWNDWEIHLRAIIKNLNYIKINSETDCYYRKHTQEAISKIDKNLTSTLNRFETIKHLHKLLIEYSKTNNYRKQLIAQQIFLMQIELNNLPITKQTNIFKYVSDKNILNFSQYIYWNFYLSIFKKSFSASI
jgi:glycosyltransferase involved in cell wall biosynthesis